MKINCASTVEALHEQFAKVRKYVHAISWLFTAAETVCALTFGAFLGAQLSGPVNYTRVLWPLGFIYFTLLGIKIWAQKLMPPALLDELQAKTCLHNAEAELARKGTIDGYIDNAVRALNARTCAIYGTEPTLCAGDVEAGLCEVMEPLIQTPQYILDCNRSKFTISALVTFLQSAGGVPQDYAPAAVHFRDDFSLRPLITVENYQNPNATGVVLQLQSLLRRAYNNCKLAHELVTIDGRNLTIVAAPIPLVCELASSNGVLLIAYEGSCELPPDIESVLLIFGRIIANWLSRYDDCLLNRALHLAPPATAVQHGSAAPAPAETKAQ